MPSGPAAPGHHLLPPRRGLCQLSELAQPGDPSFGGSQHFSEKRDFPELTSPTKRVSHRLLVYVRGSPRAREALPRSKAFPFGSTGSHPGVVALAHVPQRCPLSLASPHVPRTTVFANGSLLITQVRARSTGVYKCVGRGQRGKALVLKATLRLAGEVLGLVAGRAAGPRVAVSLWSDVTDIAMGQYAGEVLGLICEMAHPCRLAEGSKQSW